MKVPMIEITESLGLQNSGKPLNGLPSILWALHPNGSLLAASFGCCASIFHSNLRSSGRGGKDSLLSRLSAVSLSTGQHKITALAWLVSLVSPAHQNNGIELDTFTAHLMLGTEKGEFLVFDLTGDLILQQKLHTSSVVQIRCRTSSMGSVDASLEDVSVVFSDLLCCIPLPELLAFIRLHEAGSGQGQDPSLNLAYGKFSIGKNLGGRTDGFHLGIQPLVLKEELKIADRSQEPNKISMISVGKSPAVGFFEATVDGRQGGAFAFIGKMASAVTFGIPSLAWKSGKKAWRRGVTSWWNSNKEEEVTPTEPSTLQSSLRDSKRQVLSLVPSPQDSLAVSTDSLGRILLMDVWKGVVLRIWKGYREAQCAWITRKEDKSSAVKLYLVIFSRKRETIEVWAMRYGPRIWSSFIGSNNRLLPTSPPMALGEAHWNVRCAVLNHEDEEIWSVEDKAFQSSVESNVPVWDRMLTPETTSL